jgi:hypothetical protein
MPRRGTTNHGGMPASVLGARPVRRRARLGCIGSNPERGSLLRSRAQRPGYCARSDKRKSARFSVTLERGRSRCADLGGQVELSPACASEAREGRSPVWGR